MTAGNDHACAILDTGQLRCWGHNGDGQLGQGNTDDIGDNPGETTVAVDLGPGRTAVAVDAGDYHTCAVLDNGQLRCWGAQRPRAAGPGQQHATTPASETSPGRPPSLVDLGPGRTAVAVTAG